MDAGRGYSQGKGPEAGMLLVCVRGILWLEWSEEAKD